MRIIRVNDSDSDRSWLWLAGGAALGLAAGVLVAERMSGRKMSLGSLVKRGRGLASAAARNWAPLLDTAQTLKELWDDAPTRERDEAWAGEDDDDELVDAAEARHEDEYGPEADDDEFDDDEAETDAEEAEASADEAEGATIDARVLEAFSHDPVLARRAVEIEELDAGVIVLHGRVRSAREVKHAVTIARGVPGVSRVTQKLTVR